MLADPLEMAAYAAALVDEASLVEAVSLIGDLFSEPTNEKGRPEAALSVYRFNT